MAHESITPADHGPYYEGDALDIIVQIFDSDGETPLDITDGRAELLVKNNRTDTDEEAVVNKSTDVPDDAEMVDPGQGEVTFFIRTGDTDGVLSDEGIRVGEQTFFVIVRFYDVNDERTGVLEADWEITAS